MISLLSLLTILSEARMLAIFLIEKLRGGLTPQLPAARGRAHLQDDKAAIRQRPPAHHLSLRGPPRPRTRRTNAQDPISMERTTTQVQKQCHSPENQSGASRRSRAWF